MMRKWMKKSLLAGFLGACICGIAGCGGNKEESYRVIEIMQLEGTAVVTREEVGELEAYENMRLESGDQMRVEEESSVVLSLDDDKFVLVEPGTQMSLTAEGSSADSRRLRNDARLPPSASSAISFTHGTKMSSIPETISNPAPITSATARC